MSSLPPTDLVRCPIHGLHYDRSQTWGCAICREKRRQEREERGQRTKPLVIAALVVIVALALWWGKALPF